MSPPTQPLSPPVPHAGAALPYLVLRPGRHVLQQVYAINDDALLLPHWCLKDNFGCLLVALLQRHQDGI